MGTRARMVAGLSLWLCAACGSSEKPEFDGPDRDAGVEDGGDDARGTTGLSEESEALCSAALRYKADCRPGIYYDSCFDVFQHFDKMDPIAERALTGCLLRDCNTASLGACYAEAIHAVEPDWIDDTGLASCTAEENACRAVVRGELAASFARAEMCDAPFAGSYLWHIATFTAERRERIGCEASSCDGFEACIDDLVFGE